MIYPYMTILTNNTEVTYGKAYVLKGVRCIDVFVERATTDSLYKCNGANAFLQG